MSRRRRCPCVDLDDGVAAGLLQNHLLVADSSAPFAYPKQDMKQGISWPGMWKHRLFLDDMLDATQGHMLRQKRWGRQLSSFCAHQNIKIDEAKVEQGAYNVRVMLSHLRNCKLKCVKPPKQYGPLQALLAKMVVDDEGEGTPKTGGEDDDDDDDVQIVPVPAPPLVDVSSEDEPMKSTKAATTLEDFEQLSQELFSKPDAKAPLPKEYKQKFSKMKRPAAAPTRIRLKSKTIDPAWHAKHQEGLRKRIYSKAYHCKKEECIKMKMTVEAAKKAGRAAGQDAVATWKATVGL